MVVLATGLGGGTGTGATPVVAQIAREMGILTVAVVTKPFSWEGPYKIGQADEGLERLREVVDAYVVIPNDKMKKITPKGTPTKQAFALIDQMLCDAMSGVVELISRPGYINRDFEDVRAVLQGAGLCLFGVGIGEGDERAMQALEKAIRNPLLEDTPIEGARKILVNVVQGPTGTPDELELICEKIKESLAVGGMMTHGWSVDERLGEKCKVTIIASDLGHAEDVIPEHMVELGAGSSRSNRGGYRHSPYDGRPVVVAEPLDPYAPTSRRSMLPNHSINQSVAQETVINQPVDGDSELDPVPAFMRVGDSRGASMNKRLF
jgi:cell division protein FtsZ